MIKPEELRMNAYVSVNNEYRNEGDLLQLTQKNFEILIVNNTYDRIYPIELTEEWLLKFGFSIERSTIYLKLKYSDVVSDDVLYDRETSEFLFLRDNQDWLFRVQYIHQLQNLHFALIGEELTIKEDK